MRPSVLHISHKHDANRFLYFQGVTSLDQKQRECSRNAVSFALTPRTDVFYIDPNRHLNGPFPIPTPPRHQQANQLPGKD